MIPKKLTVENFMCYGPEPTTLDFGPIHVACLAGENGAGKSTIPDAITWALWGEARARRDNELIHLGQDHMRVDFDFLLGDSHYRVLRQRSSSGRGSSVLEFQVITNGQARPLTGDSLRETQQIIIDTLGMDYSTFINSALLLQGRADEFTNQPPGERKRILAEILGLSLYDKLEERAKKRAKAAEMRLAEIGATAKQLEEELSRKPTHEAELREAATDSDHLGEELGAAQKELRKLQDKGTELSLKRQGLEDAKKELESRGRELSAVEGRMAAVDQSKVDTCRAELDGARVKLGALADRQVLKDGAQRETQELGSEKAGLEATNEQLKADMDALAEEMSLLGAADASCPLCDRELTEEHREEILAAKQADGTEKATLYRTNNTKISEIDKGLTQARSAISEADRDLKEAARLREQEMKLSRRLAELESEAQRLEEWNEQASELRRQIESAMVRRRGLEEELKGLEVSARALQKQNQLVNQLDAEASRAKMRVGAAQQKLDHCKHLEEEKEKRGAEHDEVGREKALFDELRLAFGRRGIQAMIIETVLPEIEQEANQLLERMTDGRMHVAFESQRETQKGAMMEVLDIEVSDELGRRNYDLFSGGEAFRINFAIRIAISKLLAQRAGARLQTLIIDEGFGSQDGRGRDRLVEAINSVRDDFALILVVTHIDELKGAFPNRIDVVKGPAGSMISLN